MRHFSKSRAFDLSIIVMSFFVCCQIHSATSAKCPPRSHACNGGNNKRSELDEVGTSAIDDWYDDIVDRELEDRKLPQIQDPAAPRSTSDESDEDSVDKRGRGRERLKAILSQLGYGRPDLEKKDEDRRYRSEKERLLLIRRLLAEALELKSKEDQEQE